MTDDKPRRPERSIAHAAASVSWLTIVTDEGNGLDDSDLIAVAQVEASLSVAAAIREQTEILRTRGRNLA